MSDAKPDGWALTIKGKPALGAFAERSRRTRMEDIIAFTEMTGDRNPLHYDRELAEASVMGKLIVQGGVTSGILNALVAEDIPGPGTVFLGIEWKFVKAVGRRRGDYRARRSHGSPRRQANLQAQYQRAQRSRRNLPDGHGHRLHRAAQEGLTMPHASMTGTASPAIDESGRWQALSVIAVAVVLSLTTMVFRDSVTPELTIAWHLSPTAVAWLTNAVQLGFVAGALLASLVNLPDIIRLNRLMAASAALAGLANAGLLLEPGAGGAIAFRLLTGVALAAVYPPAMKLVSTWFNATAGSRLAPSSAPCRSGRRCRTCFARQARSFPGRWWSAPPASWRSARR